MKPGYNYDVTGLGWTLSGNSCVSRTIRDRADECIFYSGSEPFTLDSFEDNSGMPRLYMYCQDELDRLNFQYDSYNIVLPSGRTIPFFMYRFNNAMTFELLPSDSHVIIECSYNTSGLGSIDAFIVTDENGVKYYFTAADTTSNSFDNDPNTYRNITWLLTSIVIPAKGTITYDYTGLQSIYTYTVNEPVIRVSRLIYRENGGDDEKEFYVTNTPQAQSPRYKMRFLKSISYGPTRVDFNYQPDSCHMREMVVLDCGDTIRKYSLGINS